MRTSFPANSPSPHFLLVFTRGHTIQLTGNQSLYNRFSAYLATKTNRDISWKYCSSTVFPSSLLPICGNEVPVCSSPSCGGRVCVWVTGTHGPSWTVKIRGIHHFLCEEPETWCNKMLSMWEGPWGQKMYTSAFWINQKNPHKEKGNSCGKPHSEKEKKKKKKC